MDENTKETTTEETTVEDTTAPTEKEIVTVGEDHYETENVSTGINQVSFTLANFNIADAKEKFSGQTSLSVSGQDMIPYGVYQDLEYESATELEDGTVIITFRILTKDEIRIRNLEQTQLEQDEVIAAIMGGE